MKLLKTLGLAAVAALALMAFAGAGTASALTTLCKVTEDACSEANMYPIGQKIEAKLFSAEAVLKAGFGSVKCKKSVVKGETQSTTTPEGPITSLTFEECNCPVKVIKGGKLQVHWDAEHNGTLTAKEFEVTVGEPEKKVTCFLIKEFHCIYSGNIEANLTVLGGNPAKLVANKAIVPRTGGKSGAACGANGEWTAEYEIFNPTPLWISSGV